MGFGPSPPPFEAFLMATILVVDDEAVIRRIVDNAMSVDGHTVLSAENGEQALALAREQPVDLVLMDLLMPGSNGLEAIRKLEELETPPMVVAMSGMTSDSRGTFLEIASVLGAVATLSKPFSTDELRSVIERVLQIAPSG